MTYKLGKRSRKNLKGVHPDLVSVVELALTNVELDFAVLEGMRTLKRQRKLYALGASETMHSRHLTGHAVDLGVYLGKSIRWEWALYRGLADHMFNAAAELGIKIVWGGQWVRVRFGAP